MALFVGEFEQTIDGKNRLAIPSGLRSQMDKDKDGAKFVLVLGPDRHLWLYPELYYARLLEELPRSPIPDRETGKFDLLFGMARVVKPDSQGRVVLPEKTMCRATVTESITLVGKLDHIEIWPRDEWERHVESSLPGYGEALYEAAERLRTRSKEST